MPRGEFLLNRPLRQHFIEASERVTNVALDGELHLSILVVLRLINIDVNNRAVLAELIDFARHSIIEAHAEREQEVRALLHLHHWLVKAVTLLVFAAHRPICVSRPVHSEPSQRERMRFREPPAAHDRGADGNLRGLAELLKFFPRAAADDAAATIKYWPLCLFNKANNLVEHDVIRAFVRLVRSEEHTSE